MISVGVPTIGRVEVLNSVLVGVLNQGMADELILYDEADVPVTDSYQVNQALDALSLSGTKVKIIRNRRRQGIGAARYHIAEEAKNEYLCMVDDDVVMEPGCLKAMFEVMTQHRKFWSVPYCLMVPKVGYDGYRDDVVENNDPDVLRWLEKYDWFYPYFDFFEPVEKEISASGTQCILVNREVMLTRTKALLDFGSIPREDTFMTRKMGSGIYTNKARCIHFSHESQEGRFWSKSMFYRLHEAAIRDPDAFAEVLKKCDS